MDLGLHRRGCQTVAFAEKDPYARRVLARHFPGVPIYEDIADVGAEWAGKVDLVAAGIPCTPHSNAGLRRGANDDRDLWPETRRILGVVTPPFVLIENVPPLLSSSAAVEPPVPGSFFRDILRDLMALGYSVEWDHCPAVAVKAPHKRDRVFIVARLGGSGGGWLSVPVDQVSAWPRAGWAAGGRTGQLPPRWPVTGASPLKTPIATDAEVPTNSLSRQVQFGGTYSDGDQRMLPTPRCSDANGARQPDGKRGISLVEWARFPTPRAEDAESAGAPCGRPDTLTSYTRANPEPPLFPTPTAVEGRNITADRNGAPVGPGAKGGSGAPHHSGTTLLDHVTLWPTPNASLQNYDEDVEQWEERRAALAERHGNNGLGTPLGIAVRLFPTPNAFDASIAPHAVSPEAMERQLRRGNDGPRRNTTGSLSKDVAFGLAPPTMFPTPQAHDAKGAPGVAAQAAGGFESSLPAAVRAWPTPWASDWRSGRVGEEVWERNARPLTEAAWVAEGKPAEGLLSPGFTEWLMGWPLGWTEVEGLPPEYKDPEDLKRRWTEPPAPLPSLLDADPAPWTSEPCPRLTTNRTHRRDRLRCCGNGCVARVVEVVGIAMLGLGANREK